MARPLSEQKREAILSAAIEAVAELGLGAPTVKIAKAAGVADGTLFVYFPTKIDLVNQLYLRLNADLRSTIDLPPPESGGLAGWMRDFWHAYVEWGLRTPAKYKAARQLNASNVLTPETKQAVRVIFADFDAVIESGATSGELRALPQPFVGGLTDAIAGMVLELCEKAPDEADTYKRLGWNALRAAIVAT